jgi:preprotein translocase subunit SecD
MTTAAETLARRYDDCATATTASDSLNGMSRRILRVLVLTLVVGACGGGGEDDAEPRPDDQIRRVFVVSGGDAEATAAAVRERATALEIDADVAVEGDELEIAVPAGDPEAAEEELRRLSRPGRLAFYEDPAAVGRERPALTGDDLVDPEQAFDQSPGGTGQPIVTFRLTGPARAAFRRLSAGSFVVALDGRVLARQRGTPGGVPAIQGRFTIESAQQLAALLKAVPLPARLEPRDG